MFTMEDIDDTLSRLGKRGAQLVGEVVQYEDMYRLCYIRGPKGILIRLAQQFGQQASRANPMTQALRTDVGFPCCQELRNALLYCCVLPCPFCDAWRGALCHSLGAFKLVQFDIAADIDG